ncbi:relaxase MobL [Mycoplasma zalophidermidis]|uniref:Relaxase MobL n=1 Tax=Mycoplasma zalophidermidis TaxID=398174 RepID=A0ABS6DR94_9MOLU|nr:relaxase MobL [Mycoplasma zalophidermidis]MBU4693441.1 relaxase MobL [Mycoplasma zalophidermidis]
MVNSIYTNIQFAKNGVKKKQQKGQLEPHDYRFYKSGRHLQYISRKGAVYIQDDNKVRSDLEMEFNSSRQSFKSWLNSKTSEKVKSSKSGVYRLFGDARDINLDEEQKILNKLDEKQVIWEMIINPGDFGVENFCVDKFEWNELLSKNLTKLLKSNQLNPDNITGHWVIHANTEFPHIHLSFWEKSPRRLGANGELFYKTTGFINKQTLENFNKVMTNEITFNREYRNLNEIKSLVWDKRKHIKALAKLEAVFSDQELTSHVLNIQNQFKNAKNKSYVRATDDSKKSIWKIFDYMLNNNEELANQYSEYTNELNELKIQSMENDFNSKLKNDFLNKENDEFEKQLGNAIIKLCLDEKNIQLVLQNESYYDYESLNHYSDYKQNNLSSQKINWSWIMKKWEWEANGIHFKNKIAALKTYQKNVLKQ